ncbi:TetR/AcrR family transcriptional regulator [Nocardia mangyaensis]|uniref:TetR/AcrR family transcriptional regulator n=1 Tax=Nocardia mangyaensis TaxID=2213200 RepID=UPI00090427DF|nr:TetR/AcrR family transcriptional regulator [Nocardia mangyaensis]
MSTPSATARSDAGHRTQRDRLIAAARTAFTAHGYHGTTMEDVCAVARTSKPVLYRHFPNKKELYLAVVSDYLTDVTVRIRTLSTAGSDFDRVYRTAGVLFDLVESDSHSTPELVFHSGTAGGHTVDPRIAAALAGFVTDLATHLRLHNGGPPRAHLLAYGLIGATLATAGEWHRARRPIPRQAALEGIAAWYCSGLRDTLIGTLPLKPAAVRPGPGSTSPHHPESRRQRRCTGMPPTA